MKMYELLAESSAWAQGANALDRHGNEISITADRACSWCLIGAAFKCYFGDNLFSPERQKVINLLNGELDHNIARWNDTPERTHQEVLDLCKKLDI